jgi:hypothetical protein
MELVQYRIFFETCRLKQKMIEIDICGFLLTPVQKICKYPLQLNELLKSLSPADVAHEAVAKAKVKMEQIALLINERKRRFEERSKIIRWQANCRKWKGPDIIQHRYARTSKGFQRTLIILSEMRICLLKRKSPSGL